MPTRLVVAVLGAGVVAALCFVVVGHFGVAVQVRAGAAQAMAAPSDGTAGASVTAPPATQTAALPLQSSFDGGSSAWLLAGLAAAVCATLALGLPLARRLGEHTGDLSDAPVPASGARAHNAASSRAPGRAAHASVLPDPTQVGTTDAAAASRTVRMRALSEAIARLNVLGDTLAQSHDVTDQIGKLIGLVRQAFAADAAMISLALAGEPRKETLAGDRHLRAELRAAGARTEAGEDWPAPIPAGGTVSIAGRGQAGVEVIAAPLEADGAIVGALVVAHVQADRRDGGDPALLAMVAGQIVTAVRSAQIVRRLEATNLEMVQALATAMEAKDHYTATHAENIATMAVAVGRHLGLEEGPLRELEYAAVLHDVGKIGVPEHILNKPDRLTALEYARVTQHTAIGERIVARVDYLRPVARVIRAAHERWDGAGYPDGLAGEAIPLPARILFVCDAYDAMTSDRRYRQAMANDEALDELRNAAGTQFDPRVVEAFLAVAQAEVDSWTRAEEAGSRTA